MKKNRSDSQAQEKNLTKMSATIPTGESLAEYFQKIRTIRGLTRAALARQAKVNVSTIVRIEEGLTSSIRPRVAVQGRLAAALQIPVEYLQAAAKNEPFDVPLTNKVCMCCWNPGTSPDLRWSQQDAKFCLRCGNALTQECLACKEPILIYGRFCPQCGRPYGSKKIL
jgi:DNA-binding XRE family transcriptional regulator